MVRATIKAITYEGKIIEATTSQKGKYHLHIEGSAIEHPLHLIVMAKGMIYQEFMLSPSKNGYLTDIDIELEPGPPVEGKVTDENGNPIDGVEVNARGKTGSLLMTARTDEKGIYEFPITFPYHELKCLEFSHPLYQDNHIEFFVENPNLLKLPDLILLPGKKISGRVLDPKGKPISKAAVQCNKLPAFLDLRDISILKTTKTDEHGCYLFQNVSTSKGWVSAKADGYAPSIIPFQFPKNQDTLTGIDIPLKKGDSISGRVVDERGRPVNEAYVIVRKAGDQYLWLQVFTDEKGRFKISDLPKGKVTLNVDHPEFERKQLEVKVGKTVKITLRRKRQAVLSCQVVSASDDEPIDYFHVYIFRTSMLRYVREPIGMLDDWAIGYVFRSSTGQFECPGVPLGSRIDLMIKAPGYASRYIRGITISNEIERLVISMKPSKKVIGMVRDAQTHEPIGHAFIYSFDEEFPLHMMKEKRWFITKRDRFPDVWDFKARSIYGREVTSTGWDGRFQIYDFEPGRSYIYTEAEGYAPALLTPDDISYGKPLMVELVRGGTVRGIVTSTSGSEWKVTVRLRMRADAVDSRLTDDVFRVEYSVTPEEEGGFIFRHLAPGEYYVYPVYISERYGQKRGRRVLLDVLDGRVTECTLQAESNPFPIR
ncbi:carboxypeptidase regulatory-like domain-containing protein [Candidatus Poribacteria bacterium]|nr:carboxypeptidase regulatory-like domain-containing protein [Candidatus Poribacteria bacterium]